MFNGEFTYVESKTLGGDDMIFLESYSKTDNFQYFVLAGELYQYHLTVITPPADFCGRAWNGGQNGHFIVIHEERTTNAHSYHCYGFNRGYFNGENKSYMPSRLGIPERYHTDFMNCVSKFVYPKL